MDNQNLQNLFENTFPFWNKMERYDRETFLRSSYLIQFPKGTNIHDGNECTGVIIVKSGSLRLYLLSEDGKEITLRRLFPGELCVLSASCVFDTINFDIFVDSEENSECAVIGGCAYEDLARRMPDVKIFTLESALATFSDIMWVMQQILFMSMDKRLAIFLMEELQHGQADVVAMTHEQIAKHLGSAREVVTRLLRHFANDGIVEVSRKGITIMDRAKLRQIAYE